MQRIGIYVIIVDDEYASVQRPSGPAIALRAGSRRGSRITLAQLRRVTEHVASVELERRV